MSKKKYNPLKELTKLSKSTTATAIGVTLPHMVVDKFPASSKTTASGIIRTPTKMMGAIPVVQAGGSIIGAVSMLGQTPKKKYRKRR